MYITLFRDNNDGEGSVIRLKSISRMRIEKEELSMSDICFESKPQCHQLSDKWAGRLMADSGIVQRDGLHKALVQARSIAIDRTRIELEFIVSRWSTETHTFMASWDECGPSL